MPLYQYKCQECEAEFAALVNRGEEAECPQCQSTELEKQPSMPGLAQAKESGCGDLSLPPCGASGCRRTGKR